MSPTKPMAGVGCGVPVGVAAGVGEAGAVAGWLVFEFVPAGTFRAAAEPPWTGMPAVRAWFTPSSTSGARRYWISVGTLPVGAVAAAATEPRCGCLAGV